jgi:hypothetical protein
MLDIVECQRRYNISRNMVAYAIENLFSPWGPPLAGAGRLIRQGVDTSARVRGGSMERSWLDR